MVIYLVDDFRHVLKRCDFYSLTKLAVAYDGGTKVTPEDWLVYYNLKNA